jgi:hypothetical protein
MVLRVGLLRLLLLLPRLLVLVGLEPLVRPLVGPLVQLLVELGIVVLLRQSCCSIDIVRYSQL